MSEARGLRWSDWDEEKQVLNIQRSVWETKVGRTKNISSENEIPVIPFLKTMLNGRRAHLKAKPEDYIFAGQRHGTPLDSHNPENRVIKPALKATDAAEQGVVWKGYHGFRRGLATDLSTMGIAPKVVAAFPRHADVDTTLQWYTQTPDRETREAMSRFEIEFTRWRK